MGKIFFLMGKSASGKDTIYEKLLEDAGLGLLPYVGFTTRPMREGETDGTEYYFSNEEELAAFESEGRLIEKRVYHTVYGDWFYFSVDSGSVDLENKNYLYIGTLESFISFRSYYGRDAVIALYIETDDGIRLQRAIKREQSQAEPGYAEVCRRFLADSEDFSEEKLREAGIEKRFTNNAALNDCFNDVRAEIVSCL